MFHYALYQYTYRWGILPPGKSAKLEERKRKCQTRAYYFKKVSDTSSISFPFTVIGKGNANQGKKYNQRNELHCCFHQSYNKTACPNVILTCFIDKYNYAGFIHQLEVSTYHCRIFTLRRYVESTCDAPPMYSNSGSLR